MTKRRNIIPAERIAQSIYVIRGQRVILDADLAKLYGVQSGRLNEAVKRNLDRFPSDFMFQLTVDEFKGLLSQSAISKGRGGRRTPPYAFTEHGVAMLSSVLRSHQAIQVNILIVRAFVRLRQFLAGNAELARKVEHLERQSAEHGVNIRALFDAIRALMTEPVDEPNRPKIGYDTEGKHRGGGHALRKGK